MVLKKNPHYFGAKDVHLNRVIIPIIPVATGALPYENNELDLTLLQAGDLKRLQSDPRMQKDVFRYPYPGTWYLLPQVTKPPFDNLKVRRAVSQAIDRDNVVKVSQGLAIPAWSMIPPGFPGAIDDPKVKAIQKFDKKAALDHLKGTPFEGGKNWPKITLTMRDEALGAKPLAEAVQAVLVENLNMKVDLEVLEQRVFRERLWKQDLQFVWIRWFMDYPDPHNEYFDTFYGKKTDRQAPGLGQRRLRQGARGGARHARSQEAPRGLQEGRGDHAAGRRLRAGGLGGALRRRQAVGQGHREEQGGRVRRRRQHLRRACSSTSTWSRRDRTARRGPSRPPPRSAAYRRPWAASDWVGSSEKWLCTQRQRPSSRASTKVPRPGRSKGRPVGTGRLGRPLGGDPCEVAARADRRLLLESELPDARPHVAPLLALDVLEALDSARPRAERERVLVANMRRAASKSRLGMPLRTPEATSPLRDRPRS